MPTTAGEDIRREPSERQRPLTAEAIQGRLLSKCIGRKIYCFNRISSTNDFAKILAKKADAEGIVVIAEHQTRGRGRLGRTWKAPPGKGLLFSVILKPDLEMERLGLVSLLGAVAVAQAVEEITPLTPMLKWPNDVLLNGKKLCGILLESEINSVSRTLSLVVMGIGMNVLQEMTDFPEEFKDCATSLKIETGKSFDRVELLIQILRFLEHYYFQLTEGHYRPILAAWLERCPYLNRKIIVDLNGTLSRGVFEDLDEGGNLLLRLENGEARKISYGEITKILTV